MSEEILLDYLVDQPNVPTDHDETGLKVLLKVNASNALRAGASAPVNTHIALVLDVSSSMKKLEMQALKEAAKAAVEVMNPGDVLSVVAFQSVVYEIIVAERIDAGTDIRDIQRRIDIIDQYQGGGTDMEYAIEKAEHCLNSAADPTLARKMILFTDGQVTGLEQNCLSKAAAVADRGVSLDAIGFGKEFDYAFMQRMASYSSGYTERIERTADIQRVFKKRVSGATNAVATNCSLSLTFPPHVRAGRGYRYSPEMSYLGNVRLPGEARTISIPIGSIERDKEYSYLITATVAKRPAGNVRIIKAELRYDIPSMELSGSASTQSVVVSFTDDPSKTSQINGEVERVFDEVEIGRLVGELHKAMKQENHKRVAVFFDILSKRYEELGDTEMGAHYKELKAKYAADGGLSQDEMNYTRHKSTQKRDSAVQLVDASDLI